MKMCFLLVFQHITWSPICSVRLYMHWLIRNIFLLWLLGITRESHHSTTVPLQHENEEEMTILDIGISKFSCRIFLWYMYFKSIARDFRVIIDQLWIFQYGVLESSPLHSLPFDGFEQNSKSKHLSRAPSPGHRPV